LRQQQPLLPLFHACVNWNRFHFLFIVNFDEISLEFPGIALAFCVILLYNDSKR